MSVYTKRGDTGYSSTITKMNLSKDSKIFDLLGSVDELNSYLGKIKSEQKRKNIINIINNIQNNLFTLNAIIAGSDIKFPEEEVKKLEKEIDRMEKKLPVLSRFILPGGTKTAADLFYVRTLVRKVERKLVGLGRKKDSNYHVILKYINRLSDAIFIMARWENFKAKRKEEIWKIKK